MLPQADASIRPYKPTVNHAHLRGVEDAAPYVREATWI